MSNYIALDYSLTKRALYTVRPCLVDILCGVFRASAGIELISSGLRTWRPRKKEPLKKHGQVEELELESLKP
jgi:hypothetical protein